MCLKLQKNATCPDVKAKGWKFMQFLSTFFGNFGAPEMSSTGPLSFRQLGGFFHQPI